MLKNIPLGANVYQEIAIQLKTLQYRKLSRSRYVFYVTWLQDILQLRTPPHIVQLAPTEEYAMARYDRSVFAALSLSTEDEKRFTEWVTQQKVEPVEAMKKFTGDGFKISVSWVFDQNSFCLSVIGTKETRLHDGMVMTSWSDDLEEVILIAAYKHYVVCDGGEWPTRENTQRWG